MAWHTNGAAPQGTASEIPKVTGQQSLTSAPSCIDDASTAVDGDTVTAMDKGEIRAYEQYNSMTTKELPPLQYLRDKLMT